jgi:hypothetical protein
MKKHNSIIVALLMIIGVAIGACHASGKVGTKNHEVGVGGQVK